MAIFGLITEGPTDQLVIEYILSGWFKNRDIPITRLQPLEDATDEHSGSIHGGWSHVLTYCESEKFKQAVGNLEYIIVQIDADIFKSAPLPDKYKISIATNSTVDETIQLIKNKIIELIGSAFFGANEERIIFAISVDSIECWLLPLFNSIEPDKVAKTANCLATLNRILPRTSHRFLINEKLLSYYSDITKPYLKHKTIKESYILNPSLKVFVDDVDKRNIDIETLMNP